MVAEVYKWKTLQELHLNGVLFQLKNKKDCNLHTSALNSLWQIPGRAAKVPLSLLASQKTHFSLCVLNLHLFCTKMKGKLFFLTCWLDEPSPRVHFSCRCPCSPGTNEAFACLPTFCTSFNFSIWPSDHSDCSDISGQSGFPFCLICMHMYHPKWSSISCFVAFLEQIQP